MIRCSPSFRWRLRLVGNGILLAMVFLGTLPQLRCGCAIGCVPSKAARSPCPLADCRCKVQVSPAESLSCCSGSKAPGQTAQEDSIGLHLGSPACQQFIELATSGITGMPPGSGDAVTDASVDHSSAAIFRMTDLVSRSLVEVDPHIVQDRVIELRRLLI